MMVNKTISLAQLADMLQAEYHGDADCEVSSIGQIQSAQPGQICFLDNTRYIRYLAHTKASIVILSPTNLKLCKTNALVVDNPYYVYAKIAQWFYQAPYKAPGCHATAVVAATAQVDLSAHIGANVVIGEAVQIAKNVVIEAGVVIGDGSTIDEDSVIYANATLYHDVHIGKRNIIHSGAVIGADGFGIAKHKGRWNKIPQVGGVRMGDDVEIGANTTIDRGAITDTVIDEDVKIDNQVQIGHNVRIGAHTAIAGCAALAGSVDVGKDCLLGGDVGIAGHNVIADNVAITARTLVTKSITQAGVYSSSLPAMPEKDWKRAVVRIRQLDKLVARVKRLEEQTWHSNAYPEEEIS